MLERFSTASNFKSLSKTYLQYIVTFSLFFINLTIFQFIILLNLIARDTTVENSLECINDYLVTFQFQQVVSKRC